MPRLASGEGKPLTSADERRWWFAPRDARVVGGRSVLEPSGVLFLFAAMLDMATAGYGSAVVWCNEGLKFYGRPLAPQIHAQTASCRTASMAEPTGSLVVVV
jgi:hypothetical protein